MKHKHLLALLQGGYTTIEVIFTENRPNKIQTDKTYTYKARLEQGVQVGDTVVVDSPSAGLVTVKVAAVHATPNIDLDAPFTYKWIVQKVDRTSYDTTLAQEAAFANTMLEIERTRQREQLLQDFKNHLPEGSQARALFDQAVNPLLLGVTAQ